MKVARYHLALGDAGIERTLWHMRRLVKESSVDPEVIAWAQDVVRFTPERDVDAMAAAILTWVRSNSRYTADPTEGEVIKTPELMLREWRTKGRLVGDCDDLVVLCAAGLNAVGVETEFIVVAAEPNYPDDFSHVLVQYTSPRRGSVTFDPIVRGTGLGWHPPRYSRKGVFRGGRLSAGATPSGSLVAVVILGWVAWSVLRGRPRRR